jgi:REP element-mobilizing transposase RayT
MPHSSVWLYYHFVFATKYRRPLITAEWAPRLYGYISTVIRNAGGRMIIAGGMPDHIHLLVHLPREMSVPDALRLIKSNSTRWARRTFDEHRAFGWQNGYSAFTVSASGVQPVRRYIANQEAHHRSKNFHAEMDQLWKSYATAADDDASSNDNDK